MASSSPRAGIHHATGRSAITLTPVADDEFTRTSMWLMMGGCCLSLPIALAVLALTGTSLVESRPIFVAIFSVAAVGLAVIGIRRHLMDARGDRSCC